MDSSCCGADVKGIVKHVEPAHSIAKGRASSGGFINASFEQLHSMEERDLRGNDKTLHWRSVVLHGS
jgi:hypothetical protein